MSNFSIDVQSEKKIDKDLPREKQKIYENHVKGPNGHVWAVIDQSNILGVKNIKQRFAETESWVDTETVLDSCSDAEVINIISTEQSLLSPKLSQDKLNKSTNKAYEEPGNPHKSITRTW